MLRLLILVCAVGCGAESGGSGAPPPVVDTAAADASRGADSGGDDAQARDVAVPDAAPDAAPPLTAADYCEATVDVFCPYYVRCGRMAVADVDECRGVFLEACNARYEPWYAALEADGRLTLSAEGIEACAEHLAEVACEAQLFDLDGPCAGVWSGLGVAGDPCGPGLESFVCDAAHVCVVGLDLCGTCEPSVGAGEACAPGGPRCVGAAACVDGTCVARGLPGAACGDEAPCVLGASCVDGACAGFEVVAEGEACGQGRRCPYRAACSAGTCVAQPLLGEACAPAVGCASGRCVDGTCVALLGEGEVCASPTECVSGACGGTCGALPSACFAE